jgi:hypothetical protein
MGGTERSVDTSFSNFLHGSIKLKSLRGSGTDDSMIDGLVVFMESDSELHTQMSDLRNTLVKHWKRNEYDTLLAEQAWSRIVSDGVKAYAVKILREERLWEEFVTSEVRKSVVKGLERGHYTLLKAIKSEE